MISPQARETMERDLRALADYRQSILDHPPLRHLFLELTTRCNEHCLHCGSRCGEQNASDGLTADQYRALLAQVQQDFDLTKLALYVTGGEPLLRQDFFDIMTYAHSLGFRWGMTTNATLIDDAAARRLRECGMKTVSVSIDGLPASHDFIRGKQGAFDAAMRGLDALLRQGGFQQVQVTTVVNHRTIGELPALFEILKEIDIDSWRVIGVEPIGRALDDPSLLLSGQETRAILDFIKEKRAQGYPLTYGCSHFLGLDYERQVRDWYFFCGAGVYTASIMANGDIGACLDIERRPELIQGNILRDNLKDVWDNRFRLFRADLSDNCETCRTCPHRTFCHGGAHHSWDYDRSRPRVCLQTWQWDE